MTHTVSDAVVTGTLRAPGARLHYEVRGHGPAVLLIGNPMDANAFVPVARQLTADHTVITTDPRGINRSPVDDPDVDVVAETRADDLALLLRHLNAGPAVVMGSSGGAVSALALALRHPELVSVVVAHEPPLTELLDDRIAQAASTDDIIDTYLAGDTGAAWAKFLVQANIQLDHDASGPQLPPEPDPQALADEHFFFAHLLRPTTRWIPGLDALCDGEPRIVVGIGETSAGQLCDRTSAALAAALGLRPTAFPGGHIGFVEDPTQFADRLRQVL